MENTSASFYSVSHIPFGVNPTEEDRLVDVSSSVEQIQIVDHERKKDKCTVTLDNSKLDKTESDIWRRGSSFRVIYGHSDRRSPARIFVITRISGGRTLSVEMEGRETVLDVTKVRRVFNNVRRSDVIKQIADEYGFDAKFIEDTDHVFGSIAQTNMTDFAFVNRLARKEGFQFWIDEDGFHFKERKVGSRPNTVLTYHVDPNKGDILDFSFENEIKSKPASVTMKGRDPLSRENFAVTENNATDANRDVMSNASVNKANDAVLAFSNGDIAAGFSAAKDVFSETKKALDNVRAASEDVPTAGFSKEEVKAEAKGRFRRIQQSITKLSIQIRGNATIRAKTVILIRGMGTRFSGRYYVQGATHSLSGSSGYKTSLALTTDGVNANTGASGLSASQKSGILSCIAELEYLLSVEQNTLPNASTQLGLMLSALIKRLREVTTQPPNVVGLLAQNAVDLMYNLLSYGRRNADGNLVQVISGCIEATKPITVISDSYESNTGNLNTKQAKADDELEPILVFSKGDTAAASLAEKQSSVAKQLQDKAASISNGESLQSTPPTVEEVLQSTEPNQSIEVEVEFRGKR